MKTWRLTSDERGFTMMEVIAASAIMLIALSAMYISVVYAEKSVERTYHERCASLIAAGELDWQYFYQKTQKRLDYFHATNVIITQLPTGLTLRGVMEMRQLPIAYTVVSGKMIYNQPVEIVIKWKDPGNKTENRDIVVRGDFYPQ